MNAKAQRRGDAEEDGSWMSSIWTLSGRTKKLPYEANDNGEDLNTADVGLATAKDATTWTKKLNVTPAANGDGTVTVYLKVTDRYAGDNYQIEMTKCVPGGCGADPYPGNLSHRAVALSPIFTAWKRIHIERDKMFRKGSVLVENYTATNTCGGQSEPKCGFDVYFWQWIDSQGNPQFIKTGDTIVLFDETHTYENGGEFLTVDTVGQPSSGTVRITVSGEIHNSYLASHHNPPPGDPSPDFSNHHSAGVGIVSGCDLAPNQINASNSCFYQADLRGLEDPYNDAFVEVYAPRDGMSAVPFVAGGSGVLDTTMLPVSGDFSRTWFDHFIPASGSSPEATPHNYFHVTGIANNLSVASGWSSADYDMVMISTGWIFDTWGEFPEYDRQAAVHELGHMFRVDPCDVLNHHDNNYAWCGFDGGPCVIDPLTYERCAMYENKADPEWYVLVANDVNRFCCINLFGPVAGQQCANQDCAQEDGIRNHADPE